tara:strand:- start:1588 stop:2328 length:741 start_codon:yes stop_codon:yes gene_type:complete
MSLSALIIARNEDDKIESTLKSLSFASEIVVVLDRSTDNTKKICKKYTKNIFSGSWLCEGERRNFGIKKCSSIWILEIDADEIVNLKLSREIYSKIDSNNFDYFFIPLINYIGKKSVRYGWMACLAPDGKFCLFRKNYKKWLSGLVHPSYQLKGNKGPEFREHLIHNMSKDISNLLQRFNRNTSLRSNELKKNPRIGKYFSIRKIFSRFLKSFLSRKGYKEGRIGLLISLLNAIYPYVSAIKSEKD